MEQRRSGQTRSPRHHDAQEEVEALAQRDRRLRDDDGRERRVERRVTAEQPGLDRLAPDRGGRRGHVEGLSGEPRCGQRPERDGPGEEGVAPSERVEQRDQDGGKEDDDAELPGEVRDRREDCGGVVLGNQCREQRHTEHEQGDAEVGQLSFPDRG